MKISRLIDEVALRRRLEVLEWIHRQYPNYRIYELCTALGVATGTFYNHIFRRADKSQKEAEKYKLMQQIQEVFDGSGQRYGIQKIHAVLKQRGIKVSNKKVGELMREMGLQSIRIDSKKQYTMLGSHRHNRSESCAVVSGFDSKQIGICCVSFAQSQLLIQKPPGRSLSVADTHSRFFMDVIVYAIFS